jgi:uncharacterized membrane protein
MNKISLGYLFFAHHPPCQLHRTIPIRMFGWSYRLCTRCTGQYAAFSTVFLILLLDGGQSLPLWGLYLLPLPATADWLSQTMQWRESNTFMRLLTGGCFGVWLAGWLQAIIWSHSAIVHLPIQIALYVGVTMLVLSLKKGSIDEYLLPYEEYVEEYKRNKKQNAGS